MANLHTLGPIVVALIVGGGMGVGGGRGGGGRKTYPLMLKEEQK